MMVKLGFPRGLFKGEDTPPDQVGSSSKSIRACIPIDAGPTTGSLLAGVMGCGVFIKAMFSCMPDSLASKPSAENPRLLGRFPHSTKIKIAQARMIAPPIEATMIMIVRSSSSELVLLVDETEADTVERGLLITGVEVKVSASLLLYQFTDFQVFRGGSLTQIECSLIAKEI